MRKDVKYDVTCTLSTSSGFIADASCNCKASAMGRCNHICALLFALLDYTQTHGTDPSSITSQTCSWNKGRQSKKQPKRAHEAQYASYKHRKIDSAYHFDPQPPSIASETSDKCLNSYIVDLQVNSAANYNGQPSMMETLLHLKYDDYVHGDDDKRVLEDRCKVLLYNLKEQCSKFTKPFEIVKSQNSEIWQLERRVRITASDAKKVISLSTDDATSNFFIFKIMG